MRRLPLAMASLTAIAVASVLLVSTVMDSRAAGTNPDAFSIDMDPGATPANTATSLGSRQACARIDENN
ncbi:MAG TPA: hypothetical protein VFP63_08870, partial [Dehalococcoidia bacterium]|nr:hypothetical protein [Dehalococcoidia bacterium]